MTQTDAQSTDYDSPWKAALEIYFEAFMAFCFPDVHADIDWARGYEFLDNELQKIVRDAETGRRHADKLVKVWLTNGREKWLLIHIEVQGYPDGTFEERMYIYNYRIFDRHRTDVVSLAVLTDDAAFPRPAEYRREQWGCRLVFQFPTVNIMDFGADWGRLEKHPNPFALVVMAHIKARSVKEGPARKEWKLHLVRLLLERGYDRADILELFRFIDWLITLPENLAIVFREDVIDFMEEKKMPYITSIERLAKKEGEKIGEERGEARGIQKGYREAILELLKSRFQETPEDIAVEVSRIENLNELKALIQAAGNCDEIDEFRRLLSDVRTGRYLG